MITLVLLPGMDGSGQLFDSFVAALGNEFNVKVVSYPAVEPLGYSELGTIAGAALPTDGPYFLIGESFSGPIAISLAASRPPHLMGLILCCTFARNPHPLMGVLRPWVGLLPVAAMPVGVLARMLLGKSSTLAWRRALSQALAHVSPSALRARLRSVLSVDVSHKLAAVTVPTLYVRAAHDRVVPRSAGQHVLHIKPDTSVVEMDAPHFLLQVAHQEAARVISAFVQRVHSGDRAR